MSYLLPGEQPIKTFNKSFRNLTILLAAQGVRIDSWAAVKTSKEKSAAQQLVYEEDVQEIVDQLVISGASFEFNGNLIADLSSPSAVVSPYGTVTRGTTLNYITIDGIDAVVYGEDGVFAAECEVSTLDSSFGPTHENCEIVGTESFDKIVICFARDKDADIEVAQEWPGTLRALDDDKGLICYNNGTRLKSDYVYTY